VNDSDAPHLRAATPADADAIAAIYNETVAAGDASMDEEPRSEAHFRERLESLGARQNSDLSSTFLQRLSGIFDHA